MRRASNSCGGPPAPAALCAGLPILVEGRRPRRPDAQGFQFLWRAAGPGGLVRASHEGNEPAAPLSPMLRVAESNPKTRAETNHKSLSSNMIHFDTLTDRGQRMCAAEAVLPLKKAETALPPSGAWQALSKVSRRIWADPRSGDETKTGKRTAINTEE